MNIQQLKRANEITTELERLNLNKSYWNASPGFAELYLRPERGTYRNVANEEYCDFDMIKQLTLMRIQKRIDELKTEFENL